MDPDGVEEGDFAGGGGAHEGDGAGGGEEGANVGADSEGGGGVSVEGGDGLGGEVEHVGGILGERDDAEGGLVDGDGAAEGLYVAAALDFGEIGGDLLLGDGGGSGEERLGVVKGFARLLEDGMEAGVEGVLGDGLADGICAGTGAGGGAGNATAGGGHFRLEVGVRRRNQPFCYLLIWYFRVWVRGRGWGGLGSYQ